MKSVKIFARVLTLPAILGINDSVANNPPPNVIVVITDDQGYGDLGCHGNPIIKTPNLDAFYADAIRFANFHVSPTCTPTRAALMTGRYSNRVGAWHTISGRSLLYEYETTLANIFAENGYTTGLFGKWHLGDNYPFRPQDRGFQHVVHHNAGCITQASDYWENNYFDDVYLRNGIPTQYKGYCTDVFFDEAISFIEENKEKPFFCWIAPNAPHGPLHVPEKYYRMYEDVRELPEAIKRFYGMVTNIDDNFLRLEQMLETHDLLDNTIVIFMTDNGTAFGLVTREGKQYGFDAGLRGKKGSPYDGGHRVPFFIRYPTGQISGGKDIDQLAAHIDLLPTLVDLCQLDFEAKKKLDGISLVPLLNDGGSNEWPDRVIVSDSQRVLQLVKWRQSYVMDNTWRLINGRELFHMESDRQQAHDVSADYPETVERLRAAYKSWWNSILSEQVNERYAYITVGTPFENPATITSHDLITPKPGWIWHQSGCLLAEQTSGIYKVYFKNSGKYKISLRRFPRESHLGFFSDYPGQEQTIEIDRPLPPSNPVQFSRAELYVADFQGIKDITQIDEEITFIADVQAGKYDVTAILFDDVNRVYPAYYLYIEKL